MNGPQSASSNPMRFAENDYDNICSQLNYGLISGLVHTASKQKTQETEKFFFRNVHPLFSITMLVFFVCLQHLTILHFQTIV